MLGRVDDRMAGVLSERPLKEVPAFTPVRVEPARLRPARPAQIKLAQPPQSPDLTEAADAWLRVQQQV